MSPLQPAWSPHCVSVDIQSLHQPKRDWLPHVLQDMFMIKLSKYPHVQAIHFYCDGQSMAGGLDVGCSSMTTSLPISTLTLRFPGGSLHTSSTRAELYAILEALHM
ncbi:hypothetical protein E2C01_075283 [Portunus trituberculatus]|uniref:RNase H type-1 domain-containing protein n=1 Tax=Portunus trituberculatus TaxID=210409 RepID=A0A5B7IEP4_PORTR|nr:hypothetical protein [Portunus trituberculatus]